MITTDHKTESRYALLAGWLSAFRHYTFELLLFPTTYNDERGQCSHSLVFIILCTYLEKAFVNLFWYAHFVKQFKHDYFFLACKPTRYLFISANVYVIALNESI